MKIETDPSELVRCDFFRQQTQNNDHEETVLTVEIGK